MRKKHIVNKVDRCFDAIFKGSVFRLGQDDRLDISLDITVIHGDGTTTAAKKGGDSLGFSGHNILMVSSSAA
jgi:hypothetical protein